MNERKPKRRTMRGRTMQLTDAMKAWQSLPAHARAFVLRALGEVLAQSQKLAEEADVQAIDDFADLADLHWSRVDAVEAASAVLQLARSFPVDEKPEQPGLPGLDGTK